MPATVNVNFMTVVHAGSGGMAMAFPDVCKTPAPPAPPIPIPYPNIAQSSDTADGSSTVKIDGKPIMLKSSNFSTSSGDEAGSLNGLVSNKIKGKAAPMNASFDVKIDGKAVFRLTDPMTANGGSASNALAPAEIQAPQVIPPPFHKDCDQMVEKAKDGAKQETAWGSSGIVKGHRDAFTKTCGKMRIVAYVRQTKKECGPWIKNHHMPKPHAVLDGTTIVPGNDMYKGLVNLFTVLSEFEQAENSPLGLTDPAAVAKIDDLLRSLTSKGRGLPSYMRLRLHNGPGPWRAAAFVGIIGRQFLLNKGIVHPISAERSFADATGKLHFIHNDSNNLYSGKWMTGDYDLFELLKYGKCEPLDQSGGGFAQFKKMVNTTAKWDCIQHGPQAQWVPRQDHLLTDGEREKMTFSMPKLIKKALAEARSPGYQAADPAARNARLETDDYCGALPEPRKPMKAVDEKVTAIFGEGSVNLETRDEVITALLCKGCE